MKNIKLQSILLFLITFLSINVKAQVPSSNKHINFTRFDAISKDSKVSINLTTDGFVPTNYFEVQKSLDGINFKTIALILGPDPKQSTCDCYGCFDKLLQNNNIVYYRAKHIGKDGSEQLTDSKSLVTL